MPMPGSQFDDKVSLDLDPEAMEDDPLSHATDIDVRPALVVAPNARGRPKSRAHYSRRPGVYGADPLTKVVEERLMLLVVL